MPDPAQTALALQQLATAVQQLQALLGTSLLAGGPAAAQAAGPALTPATAPAAAPPTSVAHAPGPTVDPLSAIHAAQAALAAITPSEEGGLLAGFVGTSDPAERAILGASLAQIGTTKVGAALLAQVRNHGVRLDIVTDAEWQSVAPGSSRGEAGFLWGNRAPGGEPTIMIRASMLRADDVMNTVRILAHELAHAAQHVAGESRAHYQQGAGAAGAGLTPEQIDLGHLLMKEAGADLMQEAVRAQLNDPRLFAAIARSRREEVAQLSWQHVNRVGYNPSGQQLPMVVSPVALRIIAAGGG